MIKIELTEQEWSILLSAAALAPYGQIATLIQKVVEQIQVAKKSDPTLKVVS
jgi:hypothetical protein